jgi:hypothetical protein
MEYRRTTLHPYDEEDPCDDMESWAYPEEHQSPFYVLWDEFKNLMWRCINKQYKSQ